MNIISNAHYSNALNRTATRGFEFSTTNRLSSDFVVAHCLLAKMTVPKAPLVVKYFFKYFHPIFSDKPCLIFSPITVRTIPCLMCPLIVQRATECGALCSKTSE